MNVELFSSKDLLSYLFQHVDDICTLGRCRRLCKTSKEIIDKTDWLWKVVYERSHSLVDLRNMQPVSWKTFCIERHILVCNIATQNYKASESRINIDYLDDKFVTNNNKVYNFKKNVLFCYDFTSNTVFAHFKAIPLTAFGLENSLNDSIDFFPRFLKLQSIDNQFFFLILDNGSTREFQLSIWDGSAMKCIFARHISNKAFFNVSSSGVIYSTPEGNLEFWDYRSNTQFKKSFQIPILQHELNHSSLVGNLLFSMFTNGALYAIDIENDSVLYTIKIMDIPHYFETTDKFLIFSYPERILNNAALIYNIMTGEKLYKVEAGFWNVCSKNTNLLAVLWRDMKSISIWDLEAKLVNKSFFFDSGFYSSMFIIKNTAFLTCEAPARLIIRDIQSGAILTTFNGQVSLICQQGDICYFHSVGKKAIIFWDLTQSKVIGELKINYNYLDYVYFDGTRLLHAICDENDTYRFSIYDFSIPPSKPLYIRIKKAFLYYLGY